MNTHTSGQDSNCMGIGNSDEECGGPLVELFIVMFERFGVPPFRIYFAFHIIWASCRKWPPHFRIKKKGVIKAGKLRSTKFY